MIGRPNNLNIMELDKVFPFSRSIRVFYLNHLVSDYLSAGRLFNPREMQAPLAAVPLVCAVQPPVAALAHVQSKINAFLFQVGISQQWTLESASKRGIVRLLHFLHAQEWPGFDHECRVKRLHQAVQNAVENGYNVTVLEWWLKCYIPGQQSVRMVDVMVLAIKHAQIPVLEWLHQELQDELPLLEDTTGCSDPEAVIWLYEHGVCLSNVQLYLPQHTWESISLQMVRKCLTYQAEDPSFRFVETSRATSLAIDRGDFESLQWLLVHRPNSFQCYHLNQALASGQLDMAKWLQERAPTRHFWDVYKTFTNASCTSEVEISIELIQWVMCDFDWQHDSTRVSWMKHAMKFAAKRGNLDILNYLFERFQADEDDCTFFSQKLMDVVATNGHLAVVEWLHEHSYQGCTSGAMDGAAANGHLLIVQWLHQNRSEGCTSNAMDAAASANYLDVVQWLHHNRSEGCTHKAMDEAAARGQLEVVQWLHRNRSEGCTKKAMEGAARDGHLQMVRWLHENRKEGFTPKALHLAARHGRFEVVEWFHKNRANDFTATAMDHAARNGHLDIVQFLHTNRHEGCSNRAMESAAARSHFNTFKWLYENRAEPFAPNLRYLQMWANANYEQTLKCQALYTNHDRFGWFAHKLIKCSDFGTVDLLVRKAYDQGVTLVECEFDDSW